MRSIHPTTVFLAWIGLAVAIPWFSVLSLWATSSLLGLGAWAVGIHACWRLVRRSGVLFIALILLYAFATPGRPLLAGWDAPTHEGLLSGGLQAWRLFLMITALAVLLISLNREKLLAGIYGLWAPFKPLGLPLERIAVRLWLTLQYAESGSNSDSLHARWAAALTLPDGLAGSISIELAEFHVRDFAFAVGYGVLLAGALLW